MTNGRISLNDSFQHKKFERAMETLRDNYDSLSDYNRGLFNDLETAYKTVGRVMTVTRKQLNHIEQVAWDLERGA